MGLEPSILFDREVFGFLGIMMVMVMMMMIMMIPRHVCELWQP